MDVVTATFADELPRLDTIPRRQPGPRGSSGRLSTALIEAALAASRGSTKGAKAIG